MNKTNVQLTQLFGFLKNYNDLKNQLPKNISEYPGNFHLLSTWPKHPYIIINQGQGDAEALISIRRPQLTSCPPPPVILQEWLISGWDIASSTPSVLASCNIEQADKTTLTVRFEDDPERLRALSLWTSKRSGWADAELPVVAAYELFELIHTLWSHLKKEGDQVELVLANGMLVLQQHNICHPILLQRVELRFDTTKPEFSFHVGIEKAEIYKALLRDIPEIDVRAISDLSRELESSVVEPLGEAPAINGFLKRLVQGLFIKGEFIEQAPETLSHQIPLIYPAPCLFLRKRNQGLSQILDSILEDLKDPHTAPSTGLKRIIGIDDLAISSSNQSPANTGEPRATSNLVKDILFSKPSNAEQYAIADRLSRTHSVLVQGPPGTGKTHTIANLVGYLLSQGKTVLVCSHTSKALRVLRDKLDPAIQPLCLSVLDSDVDSQAQLSQAAQDIADRLSSLDAPSLHKEAQQLRQRRESLLNKKQLLEKQIRDARYSEIEEIVVAGISYTPIRAAQLVRDAKDVDAWIPGSIKDSYSCPLSDQEVATLYATNHYLTAEQESQLAVQQPEYSQLMSAADFRLLVNEHLQIDHHIKQHNSDFWNSNQTVSYDAIQQVAQQIKNSVDVLSSPEPWLQSALFAGWLGEGYKAIWDVLLEAIQQLADHTKKVQLLLIEHDPEIPADSDLTMLDAIISHLEQGKKLTGVFAKIGKVSWFKLIEQCKTNQHSPNTLEEFQALRAKLLIQQQNKLLAKYWAHTISTSGGIDFSELGARPELTAPNYLESIRKHLFWRHEVWDPLQKNIQLIGFHWERWLEVHAVIHSEQGELERIKQATNDELLSLFQARASLVLESDLYKRLNLQVAYLSQFPQSELASDLIKVQQAWNDDAYDFLGKKLAKLNGLTDVFHQRYTLLDQLKPVAVDWANAITIRTPPHQASTPPGNASSAWLWLQLHQILERRASLSIPELQQQVDETELEIIQLAAKIIEKETWAAQRERTQLSTQQALMGFVNIVRKIGKGKGKRAPLLLKEARQLLLAARKAVPVWIMPLNRVYESFDPRDTRFDVIIIDESSQSNMMALSALYLGHEHVVVGDKEQVTPDAIGQQLESIQKLIDTDLTDIPNKHIYDGQTSIYDLAETAFGGVIALKEHFRCVPAIIQFSNHLSYHNKIRPLREPLSSPVYPALISYRVTGERSGSSKVNEVEAEAIASLIIACIKHPAYAVNDTGQPTTFGMITLLGSEQSEYVDSLLRHRLDLDLYNKHKVLCGNPAQFQGDERDIIFLSMVDSPPEDGVLRMMEYGRNDMYKKRYNVAISRARNQLWLIHSIDPDNHLKSGDIRQRLIQHVRNPQALMREIEIQGQRTESPFEKAVLTDLVNEGYRVKTQWQVGAYRIDMVVEGEKRRLAIECDGEKFHTAENLQQDIARQTILERLGWIFVRIRGSLYFRDPERAMQAVFNKLNELNIEKLGFETKKMAFSEENQVIQEIRRNAESIRLEWHQINQNKVHLNHSSTHKFAGKHRVDQEVFEF